METEKRDTRDMKTHPAPITVRETETKTERARLEERDSTEMGRRRGGPPKDKDKGKQGGESRKGANL